MGDGCGKSLCEKFNWNYLWFEADSSFTVHMLPNKITDVPWRIKWRRLRGVEVPWVYYLHGLPYLYAWRDIKSRINLQAWVFTWTKKLGGFSAPYSCGRLLGRDMKGFYLAIGFKINPFAVVMYSFWLLVFFPLSLANRFLTRHNYGCFFKVRVSTQSLIWKQPPVGCIVSSFKFSIRVWPLFYFRFFFFIIFNKISEVESWYVIGCGNGTNLVGMFSYALILVGFSHQFI